MNTDLNIFITVQGDSSISPKRHLNLFLLYGTMKSIVPFSGFPLKQFGLENVFYENACCPLYLCKKNNSGMFNGNEYYVCLLKLMETKRITLFLIKRIQLKLVLIFWLQLP